MGGKVGGWGRHSLGPRSNDAPVRSLNRPLVRQIDRSFARSTVHPFLSLSLNHRFTQGPGVGLLPVRRLTQGVEGGVGLSRVAPHPPRSVPWGSWRSPPSHRPPGAHRRIGGLQGLHSPRRGSPLGGRGLPHERFIFPDDSRRGARIGCRPAPPMHQWPRSGSRSPAILGCLTSAS